LLNGKCTDKNPYNESETYQSSEHDQKGHNALPLISEGASKKVKSDKIVILSLNGVALQKLARLNQAG